MATVFPGMDPFLEDPLIWPGIHSSLIVYIRDALQPKLQPRYLATIEQRVFVEGPEERDIFPDVFLFLPKPVKSGTVLPGLDVPDVVKIPTLRIQQRFINILNKQSGKKVVTTIEVLSPPNKMTGPGREAYLVKQKEVLGSDTHLVEIDLLRGGQHTLAVPSWAAKAKGPYDYLISVNRAAGVRDEFEIYRRPLQERLPCIRVPLAGDDPDVVIDLQELVTHVYEAGGYRFGSIDYTQACRPPLRPEDQAWADEFLRAADPPVL